VSPPLTRTPTSRVKKEKSTGRLGGSGRGSLKGCSEPITAEVGGAGGQGREKAAAALLIREELEASMIPERDTGTFGLLSRLLTFI
jgi:hypothetical protein